MARILALLFVLLAMMAPARLAADPADISAAARGVVRIVLVGDDNGYPRLIGHGSGFAVAPDLILTNAHVVEAGHDDESVRFGIVPPQGKSGWFARIVAYSPQNDLALLRLTESGSLPPLSLFTGPVEDGADVYAVGYPGNVDMAQGLNIGDVVSPISPVKTHGFVSAGRSSKQFDTILHTASIGAGNSGGPLLDNCGRVVGANSFGTEAASQADSAFYFAVSMREISRFLLSAGVKAEMTGQPCRSIADLDRAEAERLANERADRAEQARADAAKLALAEQAAQLQIITQRENYMAIAGLALLAALATGGAAFWLHQQGGAERKMRLAGIASGLLVVCAVVAWLSRPGLADLQDRARAMVQESGAPTPSSSAKPASTAGQYICVLDPQRSRVTVSPLTDVPLSWSEDGCVNGRTPYGLSASGWSRVLVPKEDQTVTVTTFDPEAATYRTERYLLDFDTMQKVRAERERFKAPTCGASEEAARQLGQAEGALKALLPATPNERLVYNCRHGALSE